MPSPSAFPDEVEFEFSDLLKLACMLMMLSTRQFKTLNQLRKHNKGSDLHKVFIFVISLSEDSYAKQRNCKTQTSGCDEGEGQHRPSHT
jgi:RNA-binding protein 5/10